MFKRLCYRATFYLHTIKDIKSFMSSIPYMLFSMIVLVNCEYTCLINKYLMPFYNVMILNNDLSIDLVITVDIFYNAYKTSIR